MDPGEQAGQREQGAESHAYFVIPNGVRNLSSIEPG